MKVPNRNNLAEPKNRSSRELLGNIRQTLLHSVPALSPSQEGTFTTGCTGLWKATRQGPAVSNVCFPSQWTKTKKNENPKLSGRVGFPTQTWLISSTCSKTLPAVYTSVMGTLRQRCQTPNSFPVPQPWLPSYASRLIFPAWLCWTLATHWAGNLLKVMLRWERICFALFLTQITRSALNC